MTGHGMERPRENGIQAPAGQGRRRPGPSGQEGPVGMDGAAGLYGARALYGDTGRDGPYGPEGPSGMGRPSGMGPGAAAPAGPGAGGRTGRGRRAPVREGISGLILFDKPQGVSTFSLVLDVRRALGIRKAGHVGTLDPLATGLAGVLCGPASRLSPLVMGCGKVYSGEIRLGLVTDTLDVTGTARADYAGPWPAEGEVRGALSAFLGTRPQRPPLFSAVKVSGRPSYLAARRGEAREPLPERPALMQTFTITSWIPPVLGFRIEVGSGFYVRSLARDLGLALGLGGGALASLRRERLGPFGLDLAVAPPADASAMLAAMLDPRRAVPDLPEYRADASEAALIGRGAPVAGPQVGPGRLARLPGSPLWPAPRGGYPRGTVVVTREGMLLALAEYSGPGGPDGQDGQDRQDGQDGLVTAAGSDALVTAGPHDASGVRGGPDAARGRDGDASPPAGPQPLQPPRGPFLRPLRVFQAP